MAGKSENKTYIESKENMLAGIEHHRVIIWVNLVGIWIKGEFLAAFAPHPFPKKSRVAFRAWLHGGGRPQVGEVTRLGGVTRLSI